MVMCALTLGSPYYDCDSEWTIYKHDTDWIQVKKLWVTGYAWIYNGTVHIGNHTTDRCGDSLLWHELNHIKYQDSSHDWNPEYKNCSSFKNVGDLFGSKVSG